jgi:hypothetical protein
LALPPEAGCTPPPGGTLAAYIAKARPRSPPAAARRRNAAWNFLNNVRNSGARYLLVSSYIDTPKPNFDISPGAVYELNLRAGPFFVSEPLEVIDEDPHHHQPGGPAHTEGKHMMLFDVGQMSWQDPLLEQLFAGPPSPPA